jgi:hypothetical protein
LDIEGFCPEETLIENEKQKQKEDKQVKQLRFKKSKKKAA